MSKSTLALMAVLGATGGAAVTAAIMASMRAPSSETKQQQPPPSSVPPRQAVSAAAAAAAASAPVDPSGLFAYGYPGPVADLAVRSALVSAFDRRTRNPHWVAEHITPESLARREADRRGSAFLEDEAVPPAFRALLRDYVRSGYDRGHQVPAADAKWSQQAMDETFYLTNMCPQVGNGFNRDYWAHFEDFCRRLATRYPSVRIVTGPLYLPRQDPEDGRWYVRHEVIGSPPNIAVPTHFYKIILAEEDGGPGGSAKGGGAKGGGGGGGGSVAVAAFVLPNAPIPNDKPIADFEVPLEVVERASGLEFAAKLPVARRKRLCADGTCALVIKDYSDRRASRSRSPS